MDSTDNGTIMSSRPRDSNGQFLKTETVEANEEQVVFFINEFESRVIANRLERAARRYESLLGDIDVPVGLDQDCEYWSRRFMDACSTREKCDDEYYENGQKRHVDADAPVEVKMTEYECWSLGNRLFEIGEWFEAKGYERIAQETKWLARRFHAEQKKQVKND